jgi:hypothetical protein
VAIASAPPTVPTVELARRLGLEDRYGGVCQARRRIRAAGGWFSALGLRPCTECGLPVARPKKTAHAGCERARDRRRYRERRPPRSTEPKPRRRRARVAPADEREAPHRGVRWSPREDRRLLDSADVPARELARALGRTASAVRKRRRRLRGRPAPGADPVARLPRSLAYRLGLLAAPNA